MEKRVFFSAAGATCKSCEKLISKQALKVDGVIDADYDFKTGKGFVRFDPKKTDTGIIFEMINEKGYICKNSKESSSLSQYGMILVILGLLTGGFYLYSLFGGATVQLDQDISLGLLFVIGLLTGFHCIAMCGGFVISYTISNNDNNTSKRINSKDSNGKQKSDPHMSHILYGVGKTLSYTFFGAVFGLIGSLFIFTPMIRGIAGILAGAFLILYGLKIFFPQMKFGFSLPSINIKGSHGPLVVGLLNGLMIACGPLQAVYILAASTGSMIEGAKMLFVYGLGTLPVMLGFGYVSSYVSAKMTSKILKAAGVLVVVLGIFMINNGLALTGTGFDIKSLSASTSVFQNSGSDLTNPKVDSSIYPGIKLVDGHQIIEMDVLRTGWSPDTFTLQKDVPVKWVINGKEITGCNNAIQVPKLGLEFDIKQGIQTIEFTPTQSGVIPWSCWMGMIHGTFIVSDGTTTSTSISDNIDATRPSSATTPIESNSPNSNNPVSASCGCGGSCGGSCSGECGRI
ncbi:sulfite exporter TauE/SafE family protein [Candidatus Woesearchaeota archaeon]|nr:sulfite exporter TauE/SafE family protein [Candidatus Woesearchaeota archaeon]